MGDALAMALMESKGFRSDDFSVYHPAGALGKKLLRVGELVHRGEKIPRVDPMTPMSFALDMRDPSIAGGRHQRRTHCH